MSDVKKGYIGKEDLKIQTNTDAAETFTRDASVSGTNTLYKIPDIWDGTGAIDIAKLSIATVALTSTAAELNILDGVTAIAAEINTACDGISNPAIAGDSTAGRVLRCSMLHIQCGAVSGTNITVALEASIFNGDTDSAANLAKGATVGNWSMNAGGTILTLDSAGITGNCVAVLSSNVHMDNTTAAHWLRAYASSNDMLFSIFALDGTAAVDVLGVFTTGQTMKAQILYVTDA